MQPRIPLVFATGSHSTWCPQELPDPFLQSRFPAGCPPAYLGAWNCSFPGVGHHTFTFWSPWGSCQHLSPACWGPSGRLYNSLTYQPLLPVWYHLQTCWRSNSAPSFRSLKNSIVLSIDPWGTMLVLLPTRHCATDHQALGPAIQPVFSPPHCLLIQPISHQLLYKKFTGDSDESLTEA